MPVPLDYWVAAAGIAPVLALAHVVNVEQEYLLWQSTLLDQIRIKRSAEKDPDMPSANFVTFRKRAMTSSNTVGVAIWAAIIAALICGVGLAQALLSLRDHNGSKGLATAVLVELCISFGVLIVDMAIEAIARFMSRHYIEVTLPNG